MSTGWHRLRNDPVPHPIPFHVYACHRTGRGGSMSSEHTEVDVREHIATYLQRQATLRFDSEGSTSDFGAALWSAACWIREGDIPTINSPADGAAFPSRAPTDVVTLTGTTPSEEGS